MARPQLHMVDRDRRFDVRDDLHLCLPARPENVTVIRHALGAFAESLGLPEELVEDVRLAVTEACTNVVRHAYTRRLPGPIEVAVRRDGDVLHAVVSDRGRGIGPSPDRTGPGLGLPLIAAIADSVEIQHSPGAGSRVAMIFSGPRSEAA